MIGINVIVSRKDDEGPALPDVPDEDTMELTMKDFIILEAGTESGRSAVAFHMVDAQGNHYIAQTSARIFHALAASLRGAQEAFNEKIDI
jgi:hypothetical protein